MQPINVCYVDDWWSSLFGVVRDDLWRAVTVRPHAELADYPGWFVAWRHDGVHVSAPAGADEHALEDLGGTAAEVLATTEFWTTFSDALGGRLIGPATHHYLEVDPGPDPEVREVAPHLLGGLRAIVPPEEWEESSLGDDDATRAFALHEDGRLHAAANLTPFAGRSGDVGVLVAPEARGRRLVDRVGRSAASYAVREGGLARWVARQANTGSTAAALRLGFEPWCTQLAIRLPGGG